MNPLEAFDSAICKVTQDRGSVYGHPMTDFSRARALYKPILSECQDPLLAHPMIMICVKLARLIETPEHLDSWIDIAGYARTAAMILDKRANGQVPAA